MALVMQGAATPLGLTHFDHGWRHSSGATAKEGWEMPSGVRRPPKTASFHGKQNAGVIAPPGSNSPFLREDLH